jgi:sporulation protein YlmC with PRC-barrel domain
MSELAEPFDARLHLLDRQIIDVDGKLVANVDDVEVELRPDGRYVVRALLVGPAVLGPRIGGVLGRAMTATWSRLAHKDRTEPGRIPMAQVAAIDSAVHLSVTREAVAVDGFETWTRRKVIEKIPGAFREPE